MKKKTDIVTLQSKSGPPTPAPPTLLREKKSMIRASQGTTCRSL